MLLFVLAIAVWNIFMALIMKTQNFLSSVVFKVIPFTLGAFVMFYYLQQVGVIGGK